MRGKIVRRKILEPLELLEMMLPVSFEGLSLEANADFLPDTRRNRLVTPDEMDVLDFIEGERVETA
jgi:hypothetical protein